jgi:Hemerythrin HHE cation binding domain
MTAAAVLPRPSATASAPQAPALGLRAVAYQRVLHQLARRELRVLADLATWADPADVAHTAALTRHADLVGRVLLHHHAIERELLWPALLRAVPAGGRSGAQALVDAWTAECARIDARLRDLATTARQWTVAGTATARDAFALACLDIADAVDAQLADEESGLLPLLAEHLPAGEWRAVIRAARCPLPAREQLLVLGMALEDLGPTNRARLLAGLPPAARLAWRLQGRRRYRATVVRLRGAPPAR